MTQLGLAVVTYRRAERLKQLIGKIQKLTESPFELVVADDGSGDGTVEWCDAQEIRVVTGPNRGVCWNKNRGLFALSILNCDPLLILEDDIYPTARAWDKDWIEATRQWHHVAYAHPKIQGQVISGRGTPSEPFVNQKATAQCASISAEALRAVGYFDTRFKGYGVGHAEWTTRIKRAGYGYEEVVLEDGTRARANLYICGDLVADDARSFRQKADVVANRELFRRIKKEPVFRHPWSTDAEKSDFLAEQEAGGIRLVSGTKARGDT